MAKVFDLSEARRQKEANGNGDRSRSARADSYEDTRSKLLDFVELVGEEEALSIIREQQGETAVLNAVMTLHATLQHRRMFEYLRGLTNKSRRTRQNVELRREIVREMSDESLQEAIDSSTELDWQSKPAYYIAIHEEVARRLMSN
jgi:hypothetical protein